MAINCVQCINKYIQFEYHGGLIGISDLAEYCGVSEGVVYRALIELKQQGTVEIIKRYHCPQGHSVSVADRPYCSDCDYSYSSDFILTLIYVKPLIMTQEARSM